MKLLTARLAAALPVLLSAAALAQVVNPSSPAPPAVPFVVPADALPQFGAFAGFGFQKVATPQISGWAEVCHRNPDVTLFGLTVPSYLCGATDYSASASSARANLDTVFFARGPLAAGTKTGAGAAIAAGVPSSVGGSFDAGGWATLSLDRLLGIPGAKLVTSATWQKNDISVAEQAGPGLLPVVRAFGARAVFRFGLGKTW